MKRYSLQAACIFILALSTNIHAQDIPVNIGSFGQEVALTYAANDGLPSNETLAVAIAENGLVFAGTQKGLAVFGESWKAVENTPREPVYALASEDETLFIAFPSGIYKIEASIKNADAMPKDAVHKISALPSASVAGLAAQNGALHVATDSGLYVIDSHGLYLDQDLDAALGEAKTINAVAADGKRKIAVAAIAGLFIHENGAWSRQFPSDGDASWAPKDVKSVGFDNEGSLWFASPQGVGKLERSWTLFTGKEGLPYNDFTDIAFGGDGSVWFGTKLGAIRFSNHEWAYRQGPRWLPHDQVNGLAVDGKGDAWFATPNGIGVIQKKPMTLAQKAGFYETEVEKYIKRTEYGYLSEVHLKRPGDKSEIIYSDSDNDGLWTAMYGAGECFAYAATKDPKAKQRADAAFRALAFLGEVTVGGEVEIQPGYVARTIVPTSEPNPNERSSYTLEGQKRNRDTSDGLWKVYAPRWPLSKDKKYWYKTDTSSDELDGHYFFYAQYYELAAETEAEKEAVREVVRRITDHLLRNDYNFVDHDGTPTRWGYYSPKSINEDPVWYPERGLKSLSLLSYLTVAHHITGDANYQKHIEILCGEHHYDQNAMIAKLQRGVGSGNHSDDEMAVMGYYNLIRFTKDETLRREMLYSFFNYWVMEQPEMNPFFNFAYAACAMGTEYPDPWGTYDLSPWEGWLQDSIDTLTGFPLDRLNWPLKNSHRLDLVRLPRQAGRDVYAPQDDGNGYRVNGKVLPVENRHFNHWNTDPWRLDYGGNGQTLASGTVYLLPYYMGLYHGFIK